MRTFLGNISKPWEISKKFALKKVRITPVMRKFALLAERGLRKFKRKQKQAVVLRSDSGGQHICDALTIIETARMQHKNVYDTIEAAFTK